MKKEIKVKKYDMKNIMWLAHQIRKSAKVTMSVALKASWALTKAMIKAEEIGKNQPWNYKVIVSDWCKYGKNRTYVSTRIYTNAWNCKREIKLGYVDNMTGAFVAA